MKTVRIPYKKYNNILFVKKIDYNIKIKYKKITYLYEIYSNNEEIKEIKHNKNYPSIIEYNNNKINKIEYWVHGKLHRELGPSIIYLDNKHKITKEEWYKNGIKLDENEINSIKKIIDRKLKMIKVILKMKSKK
ncbi:MAG: hypothetical protein WDA02_04860 [Saccharofermentanales bacterium]